jgi:tetratricopeptide (TPR) repeat protein
LAVRGGRIHAEPIVSSCLIVATVLMPSAVVASQQEPDLAALISQAQQMLAQGRVTDAEQVVQKVTAEDPHLSMGFELLGRVYEAQHRYTEAQEAYRKAIELEPRRASLHNSLGVDLLNQGHVEGAVREFKAALEVDPSNQAATANLATISLQQKNYSQAIKYYELARSLRPDDPETLLGLTAAYFSAGDSPKALATAEGLSGLSAAVAPIHFSLGLLLAENHAYRQAVGEFERAAKEGPPAPELLLNLGQARSHLGEFGEAKANYFKAIELNPEDATPYVRIGADYLVQNQGPHAIAWLMRAARMDPQRPETPYLLGTALVNEQYYETAQVYLGKYTVLRAEDAKGWLLLGDAYLKDEQLEKALDSYQKALALVPGLASAHYLVGYTYYGLKDLASAKKYLLETLRLDPVYFEAHLRLAEINYRENQDGEAINHLQFILASRPQSAEANYDLAKVYIRQRRYDDAGRILTQLVQQFPQEPRYHYLLAQLYRETSKTEQAEGELKAYKVTDEMQSVQHRYIRHSFIYVE